MQKMIDGKGRLFGVVSYVDVIVFVVAAVLIAAVYLKNNANTDPVSTSNTIDVLYTVSIPCERLTTADVLRPGDRLYTLDSLYIGTITQVDTEEAMLPSSLTDGTSVNGHMVDRYDITLTVKAQCAINNGRYYAERIFELSSNTSRPMLTRYSAFNGCVVSITAEG